MTIEKKTIVDQIEITRDGTMQIRFGLLLVEDGVELDCKWHRTVVPPGQDLDAQMDAVNMHLIAMGKAQVDADGIDRLRALVPVVHTERAIEAYAARVEQANANVLALTQANVTKMDGG